MTMCTSKFQESGHTPKQVYDQVMEAVKNKLNASTLDPDDSAMVVMKVQDTIESAIKCWQIGHRMDMLVMYMITHAVINRSHEERMGQEHGKQLLKWGQGWTWGHHAHFVQMRDNLKKPNSYSVESPVDLLRMLVNADRHLNSQFKGMTPLGALLEEFPLIHCLTASLLPYLGDTQIGVDNEKRALAAWHLKKNPEWQVFFILRDEDTTEKMSSENII